MPHSQNTLSNSLLFIVGDQMQRICVPARSSSDVHRVVLSEIAYAFAAYRPNSEVGSLEMERS
jgi:hypothetical protein